MRVLFVVVLVTLTSCKKPSAPPVVDAGAPVARALPSAPSTLSLLEPVGDTCEWRTRAPSGTTTTLATLPGSCGGARIAWSPDTSKALVWFDPSHLQRSGYSAEFSSKPGFPDEPDDPAPKPRALRVDVRTGAVTPLPMPPTRDVDELAELGLGADGVPLALMTETLQEDAANTPSLTVDGQTFDLSELHEGAPALARAFRFERDRWTRVETALTTTGWDYALGVRALKAFEALGPRSAELSVSRIGGDAADDAEVAALNKLLPPKVTADDGAWVFIGAGGARVYVWEVSGEFAHSTGLIASGAPPVKLTELGFTDGDLVAVRPSGAHVLITEGDVGTHPRLYTFPGAKRVFASDTARAVTFWPGTAKPESHEARE